MNSCIFVSVCNKVLLFLLAFNRILQLTHDLDSFYFIFPVFSIVKQDFVITCMKGEVQSSHLAIQQKKTVQD